ncbi:hypothetical protein JB92DRAFT_3100424, partial [Gautieria morchelliformis]
MDWKERALGVVSDTTYAGWSSANINYLTVEPAKSEYINGNIIFPFIYSVWRPYCMDVVSGVFPEIGSTQGGRIKIPLESRCAWNKVQLWSWMCRDSGIEDAIRWTGFRSDAQNPPGFWTNHSFIKRVRSEQATSSQGSNIFVKHSLLRPNTDVTPSHEVVDAVPRSEDKLRTSWWAIVIYVAGRLTRDCWYITTQVLH